MADFTDPPNDVYAGVPKLNDEDFYTQMKIWYQTFRVAQAATGTGGGALAATVSINQTTPGNTNGVQLTGSQLTLTSLAATSSGSVTAGKRTVSFVASSDFTGTVNGITFPASAIKSIEAPPGYTMAAIPYTRAAGTLYIDFL